MPSFGCFAATTAASTVVSPYVASTAPSAWRATLPVSRVSLRPPQSSSTRCVSNIVFFSHGLQRAPKAMSKTARSCHASPQCGEQQRPAILPWRFEPCLVARAILIGSCQLPAAPIAAGSIERTRSRAALRNALGSRAPRGNKSPANAEFLDQVLVARFVRATQVVEQLAALAHHLEQPATRVVVLDVGLEMLGEVINALGQDRHLNFRRSGISGLLGIRLDYFGLAAGGHRHRSSFLTHGSAHQAGEVEDALGDDFATIQFGQGQQLA